MKKTLVVCIVLVGLLAGIAMSVGAQQSNDAWIPGIASLCVPGFGQFLNDEVDKAIIHFGVIIAINIGGLYLAPLLPGHYYGYRYNPIIGLAHFAWAVYSGLDAYNVAKDTGFSLGMTKDGLTLSYSF